MTEAWETDATEFGRWQSGWRARLLVARNVEKDKGTGQSREVAQMRHLVARSLAESSLSEQAPARIQCDGP